MQHAGVPFAVCVHSTTERNPKESFIVMDTERLRQQIVRKRLTIARLEEKASRCNTIGDLGKTIARTAESSAARERRLVAILEARLKALGDCEVKPEQELHQPTGGAL